jgi:ribonuclease P protein component
MGISINRHFGEAHERNRAKRQINHMDANSGDMKRDFMSSSAGRKIQTLSYNEKKNILQGSFRSE